MESSIKKIALVSEYFYPHLGGITEHLFFLSKELLTRGYEVSIITGHMGQDPGVSLPPGLKLIQLSKSMKVYANGSIGKISYGWNLGAKVKEVLHREKFDLIHIHNPLDPVLPLLFSKYSKTITVGTFHTVFKTGTYFTAFNRVAQNYLNKLNGIIAVSEPCAQLMSQYFDSKFAVIPNGVDVKWFSQAPTPLDKFQDEGFNILFMGRLDPRNGIDLLLEAFPNILARAPKARLILVGDGPLRPYYQKKAGAYLGRNIFFEGSVTDQRPAYFAVAHAYVYPASIASFGIGLLEGMAGNTPVVATDNSGFRTLIQDGHNGILVPPNDPNALAQGILKIFHDPVLAKTLQKNGLKVVDQYSWDKVTDQILDFYENAAA